MAARPRVAVVLGAGGSVGHAFHGGVLAALQDVTGFDARDADLLVGTSAGSIIATLLAAGVSGTDLAAPSLDRPRSPEGDRLLRRAMSASTRSPAQERTGWGRGPASPHLLVRQLARPWRARPGVLAAAALPRGGIPHDHVAAHVPALFGDDWPDRVWIPALRLEDGARVVFGRDDVAGAGLADAVAASCAIPGWFRPVVVDGRHHVDGGAHSPTNLDVVAGGGFDVVVVSSPMSVGRRRRWGPDVLPRLAWGAMLAAERSVVEADGAVVLPLVPGPADQRAMGLQPLDTGRRHVVARQAYDTAVDRLRSGRARKLLTAAARR